MTASLYQRDASSAVASCASGSEMGRRRASMRGSAFEGEEVALAAPLLPHHEDVRGRMVRVELHEVGTVAPGEALLAQQVVHGVVGVGQDAQRLQVHVHDA